MMKERSLEAGKKCLVFSDLGLSRSAAIVVDYLVHKYRISVQVSDSTND